MKKLHINILFVTDAGKVDKILTLSLPECLIVSCKMTLTFESMGEIL